jgi:hypothetical protein
VSPGTPSIATNYDRAMLGQGWQSQWARVQRRLEDVRKVYAGRPGSTDDAIDDLQSFFEVVHHLRDWLGNDPSSGATFPDATVVLEGSDVLRICGDLANGSKHFKLDPKRRPWTDDPSTTIARNDVAVTPPRPQGRGRGGWTRRSRWCRPRLRRRRTVSMLRPVAPNTTLSSLPKTPSPSGSSTFPANDSLADQSPSVGHGRGRWGCPSPSPPSRGYARSPSPVIWSPSTPTC